MERIVYDEFGLFHENASEYGLPFAAPPIVRRVSVATPGAPHVSALVWGDAPAQLVFVHGGMQNAHTWDTVIMALGRPAIALDLPGHGHSAWREDGLYSPPELALDVAAAVEQLAPDADLVVGMSLGGMTSMVLAARRPDLVRELMMVDVTPGVNRQKAKAIFDFVNGPQSFESFDALLERTIEHNPTRSVSSLRRGILHNAIQRDDGSWAWRYDRRGHARTSDDDATVPDATVEQMSPLWDDFGRITCPVTVVRGSLSPVVDDEDIAECRRRLPSVRIEVVEGAGHSIQGDRPLELAALIEATLTPR
jgi:pimeloyl-ACP methyl ester carboxylesterase